MTTDLSGSTPPDVDVNTDVSGSEIHRNINTNTNTNEGVSSWGLRSRIHSLTEDLSTNLLLLHPIIRPPTVEQLVEYKPSHLNDYYLRLMMFLIRFFNGSAEFLQVVWSVLSNVVKGIKKSMSDDIYVFFEGSSYPYSLVDLQMNSPAIPPVEWYYNAKTHTFITSRLYTISQQYHTHHIPYLTAEVKYNDLILYDISDFVNGIRWAGEENEAMPNADHLVSAWTLSSGIVLQRSDAMALSVINTDGEDVRVPLRNET